MDESGGVSRRIRFELPEPAAGRDAGSGFGVNLQMELRGWSFDQMRQALNICRRMGLRWSREELSWNHIMPERGSFVWDRMDKAVELTLEAGMEIMGLFAYWAGKWRPKTGPAPGWTEAYKPGGVKDYCDLVRAGVRRYKDRIKHWQIWNEPNGRIDADTGKEILRGFWHGRPEDYADLLRAAYETCKEEDPDCTVVGFNMALCDVEWLRLMGELGVMDYADVVSFHPYRWQAQPEDECNDLLAWATHENHPLRWGTLVDEARAVHETISEFSDKPKPVWVTEISWASELKTRGMSALDVTERCVRAHLLLLGPGEVGKIFWYDLTTPDVGLANPDFSPRYRTAAMSVLTELIGDRRFESSYDVGAGNHAQLWMGGGHDVLTAWKSCSTPQFLEIRLAAPGRWRCYDMFGTENALADRNDATLVLPLSDAPRYLVVPTGVIQSVARRQRYLYQLPRNFSPGEVPEKPEML